MHTLINVKYHLIVYKCYCLFVYHVNIILNIIFRTWQLIMVEHVISNILKKLYQFPVRNT